MPLIGDPNQNEEQTTIGGSRFGYSAAKIDHLEEVGATDYTLFTLVVDESSSVSPFRQEMETAIHTAIMSLKSHPRADYLLVRLTAFAYGTREIHGFRLLADIDAAEYAGCLNPGGMTALYLANVEAVEATCDYARRLVDRDFLVNSLVEVVTDGGDNQSDRQGCPAEGVAAAIASAMQSEYLESHRQLLVGVGTRSNPDLKAYLADFEVKAGFDQYIQVEDADAETLQRLGQWTAASVSSQSAQLGSGGPSIPLKF